MLRSHAFLNVRDYLAVRSQGLDALRDAMYPSRNALMKDLRASKKSVKGPEGSRGVRAELGWVLNRVRIVEIVDIHTALAAKGVYV